MLLTFGLETFDQFWPDAEKIFPLHWADLALDQAEIPPDADNKGYEGMYDKGFLKLMAARDGKMLVGYYMAIIVSHHMHYKSSGPASTTDMFYLLRSHRRGGAGAMLLLAAEDMLRSFGVRKAAIATKIHQDQGKLFLALGWRPSDMVYTKLLVR